MGRKRKPDGWETFAEMVGEMPAADPEPGEWVEWLQLIGAGEYTDEAGVRLRLRGDRQPDWRRIERLMRDPQVRVLHVEQGRIREVLPEYREEFVAAVRPHLSGKSESYLFQAGEFKDEQGRSLLVVEESC